MTDSFSRKRRNIIKNGIALGGLALLDPLAFAFAEQRHRSTTPNLVLGPFYPVIKPLDRDADLTTIAGRNGRANGQVIHVVGKVANLNGDPVRDAKIELWQANAAGRYDHPSDPNKAPLDPNFQGFGEQVTDSEGRFHFKTIKPGAYPRIEGTGMRTPHIHFEIFGKHDRMVTQMFFEGEPLNETDFIYQAIRNNQQGALAKIDKHAAQFEPGAWLVSWDVVLRQG